MARLMLREVNTKYIVYPFLLLFVIYTVFPLVYMLSSSIRTDAEVFTSPPKIIPSEPSMIQYEKLFVKTDYVRYLRNSLIVSVGATMLSITISSLAAFSLARFRIRWRRQIASLALFLYLFPPIMIVIPLFIIFTQLGLTDSLLGLILGHTTYAFPFALWFLWMFFKALPIELEEAAMIDGLSRLGALRHITLPLATPAIAAVAVYSFVVSWNDFLFAFTLLTTDINTTLPRAFQAYAGSEGTDWGIVMAVSALIALPPLLGFMFVQKSLLKGFGFLGVKR